eukprot:1204304-Alexandrium_andersonii.AAC.1
MLVVMHGAAALASPSCLLLALRRGHTGHSLRRAGTARRQRLDRPRDGRTPRGGWASHALRSQ